jgi:hypothetical protein
VTIATATKKQTPLSIPAKLDDDAIIGKAYDPHIARRLLGYDAAAIAEMASRLWTRALTRHRSYRDFFSILFPGPLKFNEDFGLVNGHLVMERLRVAFGDKTFADAKMPLYIAAKECAAKQAFATIAAAQSKRRDFSKEKKRDALAAFLQQVRLSASYLFLFLGEKYSSVSNRLCASANSS